MQGHHMKYIKFGRNEFYVFPAWERHDETAARVGDPREVKSAGFVRLDADGIYAYGSSVSLGVASDEKDTELLSRLLGAYDG